MQTSYTWMNFNHDHDHARAEVKKYFSAFIKIINKNSPDDQGCDLDWFLAFSVEWAKKIVLNFYGCDVTLLKPTNHQR